MRITDISIEMIEEVKQPLYPYVKPTDAYKEKLGEVSPAHAAFIDQIAFLKMTGGNGLTSLLPVSKQVADIALTLTPLLKNVDSSDISGTWDLLYRYLLPIGRAGVAIHSLSAVNILMYDILAKELGVPVYKILGGKTRSEIRAYASHLHPLPKDQLEKEAITYIEEGYRTMKMRFISGPSDIYAVEKNMELIKIIRDAVGYDVELAADAWMSWNLNFAEKMLKKAEKYELSWVEEPLLPDDYKAYSELCKKVGTRISAGEHHYHVYDFLRLLESGIGILQPDSVWVGGITPMKKIIALAESYGAIVIPHTSNIYNLHAVISESPHLTPIVEYLTKYREWMEQHALNIPRPIKGLITIPDGPGFGIKYDLGK